MSRVSFTEISTWKKCRLMHHWRYDRKLEPNRYEPQLTIGTLCHAGAESWLRGHDVETGILKAATEYNKERNHFDEEADAVIEMAQFSSQVVGKYAIKTAAAFPYVIHALELPFDIKIPGTRNRIVGRFDAILEDSEGIWIREWKFPKRFRSEEDLALSTQIATYQWVANQLGYPIVGILYDQILAKLPAIPELLKNGVSTSRKEIYTDWETYAATVRERGEDPALYEEEMKPKLAEKEFHRQYRIYRSPEQVNEYLNELVDVSRDIAAPKRRLYACENSVVCNNCMYREICLERARGRNPEDMINAAFKVRGAESVVEAVPDELEVMGK